MVEDKYNKNRAKDEKRLTKEGTTNYLIIFTRYVDVSILCTNVISFLTDVLSCDA